MVGRVRIAGPEEARIPDSLVCQSRNQRDMLHHVPGRTKRFASVIDSAASILERFLTF